MKRVCDRCGAEEDETWMESYNFGRRRVWVCPKCQHLGWREVNYSECMKARIKWKEEHRK